MAGTKKESPARPTSAPGQPTEDALDEALRMTFPASDPVAVDPPHQRAVERRTDARAEDKSSLDRGEKGTLD